MLLSCALALAGACSESAAPPVAEVADAGDSSDAADAAPAATCPPLPGAFGSPQCDACMEQTCCPVIAACSAKAACKPLMACVLACIDAPDAGGCARQCEDAHPEELGAWRAVVDCWTTRPCVVPCSSLGS